MERENVQGVDDELLMAYVEGRLTDEERHRVETALGIDDAFRARLEEYSQAGELVDELIGKMRQEARESASPAAPPRPPQEKASGEGRRGLAALALVAGLAAGYGGALWQGQQQDPAAPASPPVAEPGRIEEGSALMQALRHIPSGQLYSGKEDEMVVLPTASLQTSDGRYCRQFELNTASALFIGLACKGAGPWRLEALLAAGERVTRGEAFQRVSRHYREAMPQIIAPLWDGTLLDEATERALIASGW